MSYKFKIKYALHDLVFALKNNKIIKTKITEASVGVGLEPIYNKWIKESNIYKTETLARKALLRRMANNITVIDETNEN